MAFQEGEGTGARGLFAPGKIHCCGLSDTCVRRTCKLSSNHTLRLGGVKNVILSRGNA